MEIQLISTKAINLRFIELKQDDLSNENPSMKFSFETKYSESDETLFDIKFSLSYSLPNNFALKLEYIAVSLWFSTWT